ncbi:MAG TPA: hypothetical protein V6D15_21430 [Oculatellaceae cyanobacterium]|jgi:outer membrane biogenesis lipoprotein LolB
MYSSDQLQLDYANFTWQQKKAKQALQLTNGTITLAISIVRSLFVYIALRLIAGNKKP